MAHCDVGHHRRNPWAVVVVVMTDAKRDETGHDAVVRCLELLGVPGARPYSPAECIERDIVPGIEKMRQRITELEETVRGVCRAEDEAMNKREEQAKRNTRTRGAASRKRRCPVTNTRVGRCGLSEGHDGPHTSLVATGGYAYDDE